MTPKFKKEVIINGIKFEVGDVLHLIGEDKHRWFIITHITNFIKSRAGTGPNDKREMVWNCEGGSLKDAYELFKDSNGIWLSYQRYLSVLDIEENLPKQKYELIKQPSEEQIREMIVMEEL